MKINQLDSQVYLPFNYNNNNEVISRQIKENRGRINNINNEIIQMQLKESHIKKKNKLFQRTCCYKRRLSKSKRNFK